jgi:ubiquinone/menaquinone biosynthesis C-methylase UbiE
LPLFTRPKKKDHTNLDNKSWWENNPMNYSWDTKNKWNPETPELNKTTADFFNKIDKIFFEISNIFISEDLIPFDKIIKYSSLKNSKILEIGCGMGTHAELLCKNVEDIDYTGIDITKRAVELTKKRFELKNINGKIIQADAESIPFENETFDYVWSWGVIHHSKNTESIIAEIWRILKPGGKCNIMIYNKNSLRYYLYGGFFKGIICGKLLTKTLYEINMEFTDGFFARHFTKNELKNILEKNNFKIENIYTLPETDHLPFPGGYRLKKFNLKLINILINFFIKKFGWFLIAEFIKIKKK